MAGEAADGAPPVQDAPKKTPEELASEKAAKEAKAKLRLIKVTAADKVVVPSPFAGWSLAIGVNHFEGEIPEEVANRYAELVKDGEIKIELLDGDGNATPWKPEERKK